MIERIAIVTGGGDCPGLNAVIRAVVKASLLRNWKVRGIIGGFDGLLSGDYIDLDHQSVGGLLARGGTILGTTNSGTFSTRSANGEPRELSRDLLERAKNGLKHLDVTTLIVIGGDGTLSAARQFHDFGINVVGVPKTIDNDLDGTDVTFGFDSAVACATEALDRLHTTAESHKRVMVLEVMGRHAGWIALYAGVAGGADVILIPEIPFTMESIRRKIEERKNRGRHFSIVVVAEGACEMGTTREASSTPTIAGEARLGGFIGEVVAKKIEQVTSKEARACVLGHLQRGGGPTTFDRALCSMLGAAAVECVEAGDFGKMVAYVGSRVTAIPLANAVDRLKRVSLESELAHTARAMGICLGD